MLSPVTTMIGRTRRGSYTTCYFVKFACTLCRRVPVGSHTHTHTKTHTHSSKYNQAVIDAAVLVCRYHIAIYLPTDEHYEAAFERAKAQSTFY